MPFQNYAFIVGMIVGAFLIVAVSIRYLKHGTAGAGPVGLAFVGLICIGLSLWSSINVTAGDLTFRLDTLTHQMGTMADEVMKASDAQNQTRAQLAVLTERIQTTPSGLQPNLGDLPERIRRIPSVDLDRISRLREELRRNP